MESLHLLQPHERWRQRGSWLQLFGIQHCVCSLCGRANELFYMSCMERALYWSYWIDLCSRVFQRNVHHQSSPVYALWEARRCRWSTSTVDRRFSVHIFCFNSCFYIWTKLKFMLPSSSSSSSSLLKIQYMHQTHTHTTAISLALSANKTTERHEFVSVVDTSA